MSFIRLRSGITPLMYLIKLMQCEKTPQDTGKKFLSCYWPEWQLNHLQLVLSCSDLSKLHLGVVPPIRAVFSQYPSSSSMAVQSTDNSSFVLHFARWSAHHRSLRLVACWLALNLSLLKTPPRRQDSPYAVPSLTLLKNPRVSNISVYSQEATIFFFDSRFQTIAFELEKVVSKSLKALFFMKLSNFSSLFILVFQYILEDNYIVMKSLPSDANPQFTPYSNICLFFLQFG